ncbi:MAG: amidohydrolase family protein [Acidimicrobiaceae bacterium]|nr:amidohydrolase family protein [Acidimicrobiaceae bacterium]
MASVANENPYIVSVDDHVIEPAHTWESRLPAKLRDRGPRAFEGPDGVYWEFNGQRTGTDIASACVGIPLEDRSGPYRWDTIRRGCFDPVERVKDMDQDGIIASLCFPSLPGFGGTKFNCLDDRELGLACIQAYNDFQTDEWAGSAPGRLFGMVLLPYWDTKLAVQELQRTAAKGAVAVTFSENPYRQGYPSIHDKDRYWDPVFAAAQEAEMPLCMHFGSSSFVIDTTSPDAPRIVHTVSTPLNSMSALIDWLLSGVFERFPGLQVVFSESYVGWIPFVVQHADRHWTRHFAWTHDRKLLPRPPSEYFRQNVSVCLVYEDIDASQIRQLGIERVLAEADYPHSDSLWPDTRSVLEGYLKDLSPDERMKVLRTNADQLFHLNLG